LHGFAVLVIARRRLHGETGAVVVGSVHRAPEDSGWIAKASAELASTKTGEVKYIPSGNLIVSRQCFDTAGGFDERMTTNEDVDFCRRVRRLGHLVFADPDIVAIHHGVPRSALDFFRRELWHGRDSFRVFLEDLERVTNLWVMLYSFGFAMVGFCGIVAIVVFALTRSVVPLALFVGLLAALLSLVWFTRVRTHHNHRFSILMQQTLYGAARAASLLTVVAGLFRASRHSRGSWRVASPPRDSRSRAER
jgi:Glycosyl transferase family group 2